MQQSQCKSIKYDVSFATQMNFQLKYILHFFDEIIQSYFVICSVGEFEDDEPHSTSSHHHHHHHYPHQSHSFNETG